MLLDQVRISLFILMYNNLRNVCKERMVYAEKSAMAGSSP